MRTCTSLELLVQKGRPGPAPTKCVHRSHTGQPPPAPSTALVRQNLGSWWRPAASPLRSHILFISGSPVGTPPYCCHAAVSRARHHRTRHGLHPQGPVLLEHGRPS